MCSGYIGRKSERYMKVTVASHQELESKHRANIVRVVKNMKDAVSKTSCKLEALGKRRPP